MHEDTRDEDETTMHEDTRDEDETTMHEDVRDEDETTTPSSVRETSISRTIFVSTARRTRGASRRGRTTTRRTRW